MHSRAMSALQFGFKARQIVDQGRVQQEDIDVLKIWLDTQDLPKLTDEQIVLFLLSCQNDQEATRATLRCYYSVRKTSLNLFNNRNIQRDDLQEKMKTIAISVCPERTDDGNVVIYTKLFDTDYSKFDMEAYLTHLFMTLDGILYDAPPAGLVLLYDMKGMGLMHLTRLKIGLLRTYFHYLQEGLPLRLKSAHMINSIYFLDKLMTLLRPFIKKEVLAVMHFHQPNMDMEWFYKNCLPKRCLPSELGGDLPSVHELHEKNIERLKHLQDYFDAEEFQRCNSDSKKTNI